MRSNPDTRLWTVKDPINCPSRPASRSSAALGQHLCIENGNRGGAARSVSSHKPTCNRIKARTEKRGMMGGQKKIFGGHIDCPAKTQRSARPPYGEPIAGTARPAGPPDCRTARYSTARLRSPRHSPFQPHVVGFGSGRKPPGSSSDPNPRPPQLLTAPLPRCCKRHMQRRAPKPT